MALEIDPGQAWQRWGAAGFAAVSASTYVLWKQGSVPGFVFGIACALFVLLAIYSSATFYRKWMHFAESLSVWVVRCLFTIIYLTVVPVVWVLRAVAARRTRAAPAGGTHWVSKKKASQSREDMERMG